MKKNMEEDSSDTSYSFLFYFINSRRSKKGKSFTLLKIKRTTVLLKKKNE